MIKVLIVLYNKTIRESESCSSLIGLSEYCRNRITDLYVWNNSSFFIPEEEKALLNSYFLNSHVHYFEDKKNHPLSIVYNKIIFLNNSNGGLLILDHDSTFGDAYIEELLFSFEKHPEINLFLPQVTYNDVLVSPAKQYFFYGKHIKKISTGIISTRFLTAINSGMFIRCKYLKEQFQGYNEKIKFYGTDNDFMYKYSKQNKFAYILNSSLNHTLNYYEDVAVASKVHRYKDVKNGILVQMESINKMLVILAHIYLFIYECKMNIKFKTLSFFI